MKTTTPATKIRLNPAQARRVRELVEDEGQSRAEARAWVLTFEPELATPAQPAQVQL